MKLSSLRAEALLVTMGIFVACNIYTLIPMYDAVAESISIRAEQVVFAGSIFTFCYAGGLFLFGGISDVVGRKSVIVFGIGISALATGAVALSGNEWSLYATRGLQGFFLGSFAPVAFAYCYELFETKKRTLLLALINSGFLAAGILGQIISSSLSGWFGWQTVFYFFAAIYGFLFLFGLSELPVTSNTEKRDFSPAAYISILKKPALFMCYGIVLLLLFTFVGYYDTLSRYYTGSSAELLAIRSAGLLGAGLSLFTNYFIKQLGETKTLFFGLLLGSISILPLLYHSGYTIYLLSSITFVSAISLLIPTIITFIGNWAGSHRGKALSLYSFFLLTGASFAPLTIMVLSYKQALFLLLGAFAIQAIFGCFMRVNHSSLQDQQTI
ncbi:MFS transporter [Rossellomorea vietnamensis]|uniref:MFS transporter n=1 Tax=Rossellomorea vietnamensis TaxID=218284 RepID=A0A5D4NQN0_9BACI|nr:MFS transporter [Rossellomorea vietnamensis]TYS15881.1 MFS transporter [Rossellomorea vietnamensis]